MTPQEQIISDERAFAERLRALDAAATAGDLSTAERQSAEEIIECPICQGHGEVLAADYCNIDGKALGVQFYGIGSEFGAHEALWAYLRNAVPAILAMAEENARVTEPRPFDEWAEDYSDVLWHLMPIHEVPFSGTPHDSTWPYAIVDEPRLWWTPLPNCNEINRRWDALGKDHANAQG